MENTSKDADTETSSSGSILDKYVLGEKLGQGNGGIVYVATRKSDGQKVAIKVVNKKHYGVLCNVVGFKTNVIPEARNMMILKRPPLCPHIIELYEYAMEGRNNYLVIEYASSYITLAKFMKKNHGRLSESVARLLIMQLIIATQRCLEHGIEHESIHSENILVNPKTLQLKLIDFGHSYCVRRGYRRDPTLGVTRYRQQEREPYRAILFAVGSYVTDVRRLLSFMVSGYPCFSKYGRPRFHPSLSAECRDLLWWLIGFYPRTGPVLEEILEHKWFSMK
ncbi:serine/threonine-protein kinase pim-2-like [Danio aesculapii]|uniref:serine/threonine-protein kinase pim-2-like n=1 Tax=Danio aesculapii TaxID=1142201 RepID=UPI0024BF26AA|nr:serine/threonine-protein kinase pim-2-like [Danio aesculapii]